MRPRLLETKLRRPALGDSVIARPRVSIGLEEGVAAHRVVLVVAAAGSGKTTAAAQLAGAHDGACAWLTLDADDARPGRLLTYLAAAVEPFAPQTAAEAFALLDDGLSPEECAPFLAEGLRAGTVLVVDDVHHLATADASLWVLRRFLRHVLPGASVVLAGRRLPPLGLERDALAHKVAGLFDDDLAFTPSEALELFAARHSSGDAAAVWEATGGWAAGLVFEAMARSAQRPPLPPGEDALFGYLGTEVVDALPAGLRATTLRSSVLDVVTRERLAALVGPEEADAGFDALLREHLPATVDGGAIRFHPRFREFLQHLLARERPDEVASLEARRGRLLVQEGFAEEAVDAFLAAGATADAQALMVDAMAAVMRRGDWDKAIAWCEQLGEDAFAAHPALRGAQVRALLMARRQAEVEGLVRRMALTGELGRLRETAPDTLGWAVWALHGDGHWAKLRAELPADATGRAATAGYLFGVMAGDGPPPPIDPGQFDRAQPLHVALQSAMYYQGRFDDVERLARSAGRRGPVTATLGQIYRIAALRERGDLYEARRALDTVAPGVRASRYTEYWCQVEGDLLFEEGDTGAGLEHARRARRISRGSGYRIGERALFAVTEGRMLVRMGRHVEAAPVLEAASEWCRARDLHGFREWADVWLGAARLGVDAPPARIVPDLRAAVDGMDCAERRLELAAGAVFLAEACWRAGDEDAHDAACDRALASADAQGTLAPLVRALRLFPGVLARRIDGGGGDAERWRALQRATAARHEAVPRAPRVRLQAFGKGAVLVDREPQTVGLGKALDVALMVDDAGAPGVARDAVVAAVFGDSEDGANYLRQALHRLRRVLPDGVALESGEGRLRWSPPTAVDCDAREFERLVERARLEMGERRIATLEGALGLRAAGPYLSDSESEAVEARRRRLDALAAEATADLARAYLEAGRPADADVILRALLRDDPLREDAWQLLMRAGAGLDGPGAVAGVMGECADALAAAGLAPCEATRAAAARLRGAGAPRGGDAYVTE